MPEQWEYKAHRFYRGTEYLAEFNEFGDEGWELIQVDYDHEFGMAIFKRPKTEQSDEVMNVRQPHWCQVIMETPLAKDNLKYHSPNNPNQRYHYLLLEDRVIAIEYCPWCGEKI